MPQRFVVFFAFLLAYSLSYFLRSTNAVIADDLSADLGLSAAQLGFMTSLFFATFAAAQLPLGSALDRFGARVVTPLLMLSSVIGSLLFAFAQSFMVLALGRALIGLGTAGNLMGALKSFSGWFETRRFATISSLYLALGSSGALLATTPLAILSDRFGWRNVFIGGAAASLLSAIVILVWGRDAPRKVEARGEGSFADIFRDLRFWRVAFLNFAIVGSLFAYQGLWAGPFLRDVVGLGNVAAGNLLLVMSAGVTFGYFIAGFLGDRFGLARTLALSTLAFTLVQGTLALFGADWPRWSLLFLFTAFGVAGAFAVLMFAQIRQTFPAQLTGRAVTAVNLFGIGGGAVLQWGLGVLVGSFGAVGSVYSPAAYSAAFVLTASLCLAALLFYLPMLRNAPGSF